MNWIVPENTPLYYCNAVKHNGEYAIKARPMAVDPNGKARICITGIKTYNEALKILERVKVPNPKKRKRRTL